jgi:hypothetical protein
MEDILLCPVAQPFLQPRRKGEHLLVYVVLILLAAYDALESAQQRSLKEGIVITSTTSLRDEVDRTSTVYFGRARS